MNWVFSIFLVLLTALAGPASAATLGVFTKNYGTSGDAPLAGGELRNNHVRIRESGPLFYDAFDFSSLTYESIDQLVLTLEFNQAGPRVRGSGEVREAWDLNIQGSLIGPTFDNFVGELDDQASPQDFVLSAATDIAPEDAFATAVANQSFVFWFDEIGTIGDDTFQLFAATLTVIGTPSVVPLPAPVWLLLTALGGLGAMRRLQSRRSRMSAVPAT